MISESKTERIDVRTTAAAKGLLQRAAAASHKNVTEFLLDAGLRAAEDTLLDRKMFALDDDRWEEFQSVLDRPVRHNDRMASLLKNRSTLET